MRNSSLSATCVATLLSLSIATAAFADELSSPPSNAPPADTAPAAGGAIQPVRPGSGLIDDTDPAWVWSGMVEYDDPLLYGSSGHAGGPGTSGTYTFHGTAVDVYGMDGPSITTSDGQVHRLGKAEVLIDDEEVDLTTVQTPDVDYHALISRVANLPEGNHVVQIRPQDGWVVVDYINVTDPGADVTGYTGPSVLPAGDYAIIPRNATDKRLDTPNLTDNTTIDIYSPSAGRAQVWHITPLGKERYRISPAAAPTEALSMLGPDDGRGGLYCGLYRYVGNPAQQWLLVPTDSGYYQLLFAAATTACLDVKGSFQTDGTPLVAFPNKIANASKSSYNEQFTFEQVK
jgi:hypothetical protein